MRSLPCANSLWFKDKFRLWTLVNKHLRAFADGVLSHMRESEFLRHVGILTGLVDSAAYSFRVAEAYVDFADTFLPSETRFITLSKGSGTRIKTAIVFDELQKVRPAFLTCPIGHLIALRVVGSSNCG